MRLSWGLFFLGIWLYRCAYSYLGQAIVANLTTLGDSSKFQRSVLTERDIDLAVAATDIVGVRSVSTVVTEYIGFVFSRLFFENPVLVNVGFQTVAFAGIAAFLLALPSRYRLLAAAFILLPSFSLWSSVASKESVVVFGVGLICAHIVKQLRREDRSILLLLVGLLIVAVYKNHYLPALFFIMGGIFLSQRVRQADFLAFFGLVVSFVPLYFLKERLATMALAILPHFLNVGVGGLRGRLTREAFWQGPEEVFWKAPEGIALSFFGPTFQEASIGFLQLASFLESSLMLLALIVVLLWRLPRAPLFVLFLTLGGLFWILFANYPFGVMNAGAAIRYRTGYEMIVILLVVFVFSHSTYTYWRWPSLRRRRKGPDGPGPVPVKD